MTKAEMREYNRGFKNGIAVQNGAIEVLLGIIEQFHFSLSCSGCDAGDGVGSRKEAREAGWRDIVFDDGASWNFMGRCPDCIKDDAKHEKKRKRKKARR